MTHRVYLELGQTKIVACSLDWPGWARFGKTEQAALDALHESTERYQVIAELAGLAFAPGDPVVSERVKGNSTTDWGAPAVVLDSDTQPVDALEAGRAVALLHTAWDTFDLVVAESPKELRKGPRGGGRSRDVVVGHLVDTERAYARKMGVRHKPFTHDNRAALTAMREEMVEVLGKPTDGSPLTVGGWPAAYAARRTIWHVIDHIWEIEDGRF